MPKAFHSAPFQLSLIFSSLEAELSEVVDALLVTQRTSKQYLSGKWQILVPNRAVP
jgi:hypothetical protein